MVVHITVMVLIECKIIIVMNYTHNSIIKLTIILRFTSHEVVLDLDLRTLSIDFDIYHTVLTIKIITCIQKVTV